MRKLALAIVPMVALLASTGCGPEELTDTETPTDPGSEGQVQDGLTAGSGLYDDSSSYITYTGTWYQQYNSRSIGSYCRYAFSGNRARLTFYGNRVTVWFKMDYQGSSSSTRVFIDGVEKSGISTYSSTAISRVGKTYNVAYGTHTIELVGSYGTSYLDAFEVNAAAPSVTTFDDRDTRLRYFGSWTAGSFSQAYAGTLKWSRNTADGVSFTFSGSYLNYVFTKAYNRGYATVVIDGSVVRTIDLYASSTLFQQSSSFSLLSGIHTVTISVTGRRNSVATDNYIDIDRLVVQ